MTSERRKVLLIGAGLMAKPALQILDKSGIAVTVGCRDIQKSTALCAGTLHAHPISLDATDPSSLEEAMSNVDLVVSLVPYTLNVPIVQAAIRTKKNVLTTSYISPGLLALEPDILAAGITVMNECGLDPGIDHCYAIKTIEEVHAKGGKIKSFISNCGGLPAPEASDNPFGLKLSWSARGVLLASQSMGRFVRDGQVVEIPAGTALMDSAEPYFVYPAFSLVTYANRDSSHYTERYGIPEAQNVLRGTMRYTGCVEIFKALGVAGFIDTNTYDYLHPDNKPVTWKEVTSRIVGAQGTEERQLVAGIESRVPFRSEKERSHVIHALKWLGLFSDEPAALKHTPVDTLSVLLEEKLRYAPGERDMVLLQHKFEIEWSDGTQETRTSTLLEYGDPNGFSAMARLVGTACAVGSQLILDKTINKPGLLAPVSTDITVPLMQELKKYGIELKEKVVA